MNLEQVRDSEARFSAYVEGLASVIGHAARTGPLRDGGVGQRANPAWPDDLDQRQLS